MTATDRWDVLHADPRHRLRWPSEHVVRWLEQLPTHEGSALDIGCGHGRHTRLLKDFGWDAVGVDAIDTGSVDTVADMTELPFEQDTFDVALAYGVFYYGTTVDMGQAVNEMHRVLKPGGHGFIKTRSIHDWRAQGVPEGEPEHGMEMSFLSRDDVPRVFAAFSEVRFEATATSWCDRERWDSDWLITVTK